MWGCPSPRRGRGSSIRNRGRWARRCASGEMTCFRSRSTSMELPRRRSPTAGPITSGPRSPRGPPPDRSRSRHRAGLTRRTRALWCRSRLDELWGGLPACGGLSGRPSARCASRLRARNGYRRSQNCGDARGSSRGAGIHVCGGRPRRANSGSGDPLQDLESCPTRASTLSLHWANLHGWHFELGPPPYGHFAGGCVCYDKTSP